MSFMHNIGPNKNSKHKQSIYKPKNPGKYLGDPERIIMRSSWEGRFMTWCDLHPDIVKWSSEPIGIAYLSPLDQRQHKYFVDFWVLIEKDGGRQQYLIEIKPDAQTKMPDKKLQSIVNEGRATTKQLTRYNRELRTYIINQTKFAAAMKYAASQGMKFQVCSENFLF